MKKNAHAMLRACSSLVFVSVLGLPAGCLYMGDPGHIEADPNAVVGMEGARLELIRHSTGCGSSESEGLIVEVGPWVEYSADAVSALKANCELALHPGVEVHVDGNAVVFDFSNVAAPGRFPANEFEGYILDMVRTADAPVLIAALVDWKLTTMDLIQDDLTLRPGPSGREPGGPELRFEQLHPIGTVFGRGLRTDRRGRIRVHVRYDTCRLACSLPNP